MAAPVASFIQLPDDTVNTGKKVHTETKVVGSNTVHEHFYVPFIGMTIIGHYYFSSVQQSIVQTGQAPQTTASFWIINPLGSSITMVLRSIIIDANAGSALASPNAPVINFNEATYTGTPTGATVPAFPSATGVVPPQVSIRTAITGMTVSVGNTFGHFSVPSALTAIGPMHATKVVYAKNPLAFVRGLDLEFVPGEVISIWQSGSGSNSDTRKFTVQMEWDEVDLS